MSESILAFVSDPHLWLGFGGVSGFIVGFGFFAFIDLVDECASYFACKRRKINLDK